MKPPAEKHLTRRAFGRLTLALAAAAPVAPAWTWPALAGGSGRRISLQPFANAPFPYRGKLPESDVDFLDVIANGRRGHTSPRGGVYWEDVTYNDNRVLLALPRGFDLKKKTAIVVYFHGNGATLERDVLGRQAIVEQLEASGLNAALVAPQFAVDALDSSAGRFWQRGAFAAFMAEAAARLGKLHGDKRAERVFAAAPIFLVAYSGGYSPAAYVLAAGDDHRRLRGVILLDAVYGNENAFAQWVIRQHKSAFFFSAYSKSAEAGNRALKAMLERRQVPFEQGLPAELAAKTISFLPAPDVDHNDFVTRAWGDWPLGALLSRVVV